MTAPVAGPRFFVPDAFVAGATVTAGEDAARHIRVLRVGPGSPVTLLDGQGARAAGTIRTLAKRSATIAIDHVEMIRPPSPVHALVPIADRDRMLWLAEKAAELGLASWRPVLWKRSRSVSPRGEGSGFHQRLGARMASALEQSGNAWLPAAYPDTTLDRALASLPDGARFVLHADGEPAGPAFSRAGALAITIAIGPEGGFDDAELTALRDAGFQRASLGPATMRFETAGIVGIAHARASLDAAAAGTHRSPSTDGA